MVLSIQEAYNILELRKGANTDEIVNGYKRLALEWHPDKHHQSEISYENFYKINNAFQRLIITDEKEITKPLTKEKMFELFEDVYIKKKFSKTSNESNSSSGSKKQQKEDIIASNLNNKHNTMSHHKEVEEMVSSDEDDKKTPDNLAAEEEKKKNAEKRRAKKKRRKEAKKLEKEKEPPISKENTDLTVTTVTSQPKEANTSNTSSNRSSLADTSLNQAGAQVNDQLILQSRRLATRGNELASDENFIAAVELFSEAIKINSKDFRFYGNRSYCYDKLGLFSKALADAEKAIELNPDWSKNYHRKGRALAGLKKYAEAETLFEAVLKMDKDCSEAKQELYKVRLQQLMEMGFTKLQAETAILQHKSVAAALDALLQAPVARSGAIAPPSNDVYVSDDENQSNPTYVKKLSQLKLTQQAPIQEIPKPLPLKPLQQKPLLDIKMDPSNPEGLNSLWVGNISKDVDEASLKQLFSPYGRVVSVKKKPDTYYAFVEYADKANAGVAMRALQGVLFGTQNLYIRFPGKTGASGHPNNNPIVIKKPTSVSPTSNSSPFSWPSSSYGILPPPVTKPKGPVNGNECYFWRTTGCSYGDKCKFLHILANKGIDRKPWQTATA